MSGGQDLRETPFFADSGVSLDELKRDRANLLLLLDDIDEVTPERLVELKITARVVRKKMEVRT